MDQSQLGRANYLVDQYNTIGQAITNLEAGGKIVFMDVTGGGGSMAAIKVATDYINPPPQMIDTIVQLLHTHQMEVGRELTSLGVTGLEGVPGVKRKSGR